MLVLPMNTRSKFLKGFASLDRMQAGEEMLVRMVAILDAPEERRDDFAKPYFKHAKRLTTPFEHD
jgi:hypothetical protein